MAPFRIQSLSEDEALEQIVETVQQAETGSAPFALVLGSGFSHGLVPTARELVEVSLPIWVKSRSSKESFDQLKRGSDAERSATARLFWQKFVSVNESRGLHLPRDQYSGLPIDYSAAYRAAFNPMYRGAVGEPAQARKFQRILIGLDQPRLNAAHFLLASLLGVQPGKSRRNDLFRARSAFCRLILTTNFDPFLQIALQSVNRLYFMSDTPELGVSDEIMDDQSDAIHLVYVHGSIHRRSQAATEEDIAALKEKNAKTLKPVLERHGVIVLGYSGWDDAIVEALAACDRFDHRLYWCGREADPLGKGSFGPRVADILHKPAAVYVKISSAGYFMGRLCTQLVDGLPRLLYNPVGQLREMLETFDLTELEPVAVPSSTGSASPQPIDGHQNADVFVKAQRIAIERLAQAEQAFLHPSDLAARGGDSSAQGDSGQGTTATPAAALESQASQLESSAHVAAALGDYVESVKLYSQGLELSPPEAGAYAELLMGRAIAFYRSGNITGALEDWSQVIELPGAPVEQVAQALRNRGVTWGQKGDTDKALADYTRVIEQLPVAPVEQVAKALNNRGVAWGLKGDTEKALADYTRVIEQLPGAPVEPVAQALYNRGVAWGQKGETDKALADYTRVIEQLPGTPVEQVANALHNRGVAWGQKGDTAKELADYTRLIEQLPGAPVEPAARALYNRGVIWGQKGNTDKALADYTRVIEQLPGAPVEQVANALAGRGCAHYLRNAYLGFLNDTEAALRIGAALDSAAFNRGLALLACGRDVEALAAYGEAARQFPNAVETEGLPDLVEAQKSWLSQDRAEPVIRLLRPDVS